MHFYAGWTNGLKISLPLHVCNTYNQETMTKVINIRGTYGSGKTTLARFLMDSYVNQQAQYINGRKRPLYYTLDHPNGGNPLAVLGSYETVCGGCDTITEIALIYDTVDFLQSNGYDVFYESLLLTADVNRTAQWYTNGWDLHIIYLNVPTQVCIDSVNARRRAKDPNATDVDTKNLLLKIQGCKSSRKSLEARGVPCYLLDRVAAFQKTLDLLGVQNLL
jgi:hypothetical protein